MQRQQDTSASGTGEEELDELDELPPHLQRYGRRVRNACEFSGPSVLSQECDEGSVEYKLRLQPAEGNYVRFQQLVTQMQFRLSEGGGTCFYCIGVEDNGHPRGLEEMELKESLLTLEQMALQIGAEAKVMQMPPGTEDRQCAVVKVQMKAHTGCLGPPEIRIAVAGSADSGKSTLIAVLTHGSEGKPTLDNGRGAARMSILRHKHEIESGRTSCVTHCILGYGESGRVLNYDGIFLGSSVGSKGLTKSASRFVRFSDLAGHERFSKTLIRGMTSTRPHYVMVCVCACSGVSATTADHLAVAFATGAPPFVVITKSDTVKRERMEELMKEISALVAAAHQKSVAVSSPSHAKSLARTFKPERLNLAQLVPIFAVSSLTGESVDRLHAFFTQLPLSDDRHPSDLSDPASGQGTLEQDVFQIDSVFDVPSVGCVLSGVVVSGHRLDIGSCMYLGPIDDGGRFKRVKIVGIRRAHEDISSVCVGQHATVAVHQIINEHDRIEDADKDNDNDNDDGEKTVDDLGHSHSRSHRSSLLSSCTVDANPPGLYKITSSAADLEVLGRSWEVAIQKSYSEQGFRISESERRLDKIRIRKGAVLLGMGTSIAPVATFKFAAYVMFSSLSGNSLDRLELIVHCNGIRQMARIISVDNTRFQVDGMHPQAEEQWKIAKPSCVAAIRLLQNKRSIHGTENDDKLDSHGIQLVESRVVRFEFLHRPEWIVSGARLIMQERGSGRIVGAGMVVSCDMPGANRGP